jgi:hypothetical protein
VQKTFLRTVWDETMRVELGSAVLADLAIENLELSTPARSRAVRQSVIERRASESSHVAAAPDSPERLPAWHEVVGAGGAISTGSRRAA